MRVGIDVDRIARTLAVHGRMPAADEHGHRTRYSDSSHYDEVCVMCGGTDGSGDSSLRRHCTAVVTDKEAAELTEAGEALRRQREVGL